METDRLSLPPRLATLAATRPSRQATKPPSSSSSFPPSLSRFVLTALQRDWVTAGWRADRVEVSFVWCRVEEGEGDLFWCSLKSLSSSGEGGRKGRKWRRRGDGGQAENTSGQSVPLPSFLFLTVELLSSNGQTLSTFTNFDYTS